MISVTQALSIISETPYPTSSVTLPLIEARALILFSDIISPIQMPPFRQASMDGYALSIDSATTYQIIGEVKAGDAKNYNLQPGEAVRIFTGARVPDTANTVIMQEKVIRTEHSISVQDIPINNQNIRFTGEQIKKGDTALRKGTRLTPAAIGFLAGLGIKNVTVYKTPNVAIIATGNELIPPGDKLPEGKIYESNSIQLEATLHQLQIKNSIIYNVEDDYKHTKNTIKKAIQNNDLVLISGGISVGDYDFVRQALTELHTEELFYKIKQKPGKPLYFGKNNQTLIFALPGNPASSLTCFYIYALPIIHKILGKSTFGLQRCIKTCISSFSKKGDRAQFLKAKVSRDTVEILEGQSSAMLYTYAIANALIYIPEDVHQISKNDSVETILLQE